MQQHFVDITHALAAPHRLAYTEWGDPGNPKVLVCVHGLSRNSRDFDYLAQSMSQRYRVLCPDMPGRGKSAYLDDPKQYNYGTYVADMESFLHGLNVGTVDWVGTSMGGIIGILTAAANPARIRALLLNDIGPLIPGKSLRRILDYVSKPSDFATFDEAEKAFRIKCSTFGIEHEAHWQHVLAHSIEQRSNGRYHFTYDPRIIRKPAPGEEIKDIDLWQQWNQLTVPTCVIRGGQSDVLLAETAQQMTQTGPKARLIEFAGIGHAPMLMSDDQISCVQQWFGNM